MDLQSCFNVLPRIAVKHSKESYTVPDMSFTPREIIQKFSRGEKVPLGFAGKYDSEDDSDSLSEYEPQIFEDDPTRDPSFDFGDYVEETLALKERENARRRSKRKSNSEKMSVSEESNNENVSVESPAT